MQKVKIQKDKIKNIVKGKYTILVLLGVFIFLILNFYFDHFNVNANNYDCQIQTVGSEQHILCIRDATSTIIRDVNGTKVGYVSFKVKNESIVGVTPLHFEIQIYSDSPDCRVGKVTTTISKASYTYQTSSISFVGHKCKFTILGRSDNGGRGSANFALDKTFDFTHYYMLPLSNSLGEQTLEPLNVGFTPQHLRGALSVYSRSLYLHSHYLAIDSRLISSISPYPDTVSNLGFMKDGLRKGLISGMLKRSNIPPYLFKLYLLKLYSNDEKGCGIEMNNATFTTKTTGYWYNLSSLTTTPADNCNYYQKQFSPYSPIIFKPDVPSLEIPPGQLIFSTSSATDGLQIPLPGTWCGLKISKSDYPLAATSPITCKYKEVSSSTCPDGYVYYKFNANIYYFETCVFAGI
jgi:hypothetical protein